MAEVPLSNEAWVLFGARELLSFEPRRQSGGTSPRTGSQCAAAEVLWATRVAWSSHGHRIGVGASRQCEFVSGVRQRVHSHRPRPGSCAHQ